MSQDQPAQATVVRPKRPVVVLFFVGLSLIVAAGSVYAVVTGRLAWPFPVLAAFSCVYTAQGVWRLREWARLLAIVLIVAGLIVVACGVPSYWEHTIIPIASLLGLVCSVPLLVPLALLLYWFLSNEEYFQ